MEIKRDDNIYKSMEMRVFNPYTDTMIPQYTEIENQRLSIISYGDDNLYPQYLVSLMNRSSRHSAILKTKAQMIGGGGFNKDVSPEMINFLKNSRDEYDLDELLHRYSYDLEIYGGFFINIIWSKDRNKISQLSYVDPLKVRIATPFKNGDRGYWVSQDWSRLRKYPPIWYPAFSTIKKQKGSQIMYVKEYRPGIEYYAQPEYLAAVNWMEMEWSVSQYHINNIKNGWAPSMHINFSTGIPSDEEMDTIIRRLKNEYENRNGGTGKILFTFSENKDNAPVFTPIESNNNDENFIQLLGDIENGIYQGHRITNTSLFGVKTSGELGNTNEILEYLSIFQTQYINNKQLLIEKVFNKIGNINNFKDEFKIEKYTLKLDPKLEVRDLLDILESTSITNEQKKALLIELGFGDEVVNTLVIESIPNLSMPVIQKMSDSKSISFDYDNTLSTKRGKELAKKLIKEGNKIYIISARTDRSGMLEVAKELNIPDDRVYAMGNNIEKIRKIKSLDISKHYDNNSLVIKEIPEIGIQFENFIEPISGETEDKYIGRCISYVMNNGETNDEKQAYAICKSKWDNKK